MSEELDDTMDEGGGEKSQSKSKSKDGTGDQKPTLEGKDAERKRKDDKAGVKMKRSSKDTEEVEEAEPPPPIEQEYEEVDFMDDFEILEDDDEEDETLPLDPSTYKLEPITPFDEKAVTIFLRTLMEEELLEYVYDAESGPRVARALTMTIMQAVHGMKFSRHKLIVVVDVVERIHQAVHSTVRFLWDTDRDNMAMATLQGDTFYAVCIVFALYYD